MRKGPIRNPSAERTTTDIAAELGITHQAVAQAEARALKKLRKALQLEGLTFEDLCPPHDPRDDDAA